jgi:ABC-type phosphate transport system permease subunit
MVRACWHGHRAVLAACRRSSTHGVYCPVPFWRRQQRLFQNLLTGVPYLGALVSGPPVGIGILSAGIILAIMIIPFIASVMRDVSHAGALKESAYGLGSTHLGSQTSKVVLLYTAGVIGGTCSVWVAHW